MTETNISAKSCAPNSSVLFHFPIASLQHIDSEIAAIERLLNRYQEVLAPHIADLEKFKAMRRVAVRLEAKK